MEANLPASRCDIPFLKILFAGVFVALQAFSSCRVQVLHSSCSALACHWGGEVSPRRSVTLVLSAVGIAIGIRKLSLFLFFPKIIYFWLHWVFTAARAFASCGGRGCSWLSYTGFSLWWLLCLWSMDVRVSRLQ